MRYIWLAAICGMIFAGPAFAGSRDFVLVNQTGVEIAELYISPVAKANWGEDALTVKSLQPGAECLVKILREETGDFWDLKIVDQEGTSLEWPELQLSAISKVTLTIESGTPIATYE